MNAARPPFQITSGSNPRSAVIDDALIAVMTRALPCQSRETVSEVLGISQNTWQKIKRGEPIRASTAERFARRLGWPRTEDASAPG